MPRRGDRGSVRDEIVASARRLLEERGVEEAVTLRAVARGAGIAAPSVYNHFPDVAAVLEAVIQDAYDDYDSATRDAVAAFDEPLDRIRAMARCYIRFAREQPATYRVLFARHRPSPLPAVRARALAGHEMLIETVAQCAPHGRPDDLDARTDAALLWAALHGIADLPPSHPRFPWPDEDELIERLLRSVVLPTPTSHS